MENQSFVFNKANQDKVAAILSKYPPSRKQSALLPLLDLAQRQNNNWLSRASMDHIGKLLEISSIKVYEVATFYTMFNLKPVGKYFLQVCTTTPCWLAGSDEVMKACKEFTGLTKGQTTEDGVFTLTEVECLGACVNAPMMQINDDYYEDLDGQSTKKLLNSLKNGEKVTMGPQNNRKFSEPIGGKTTLLKEVKHA